VRNAALDRSQGTEAQPSKAQKTKKYAKMGAAALFGGTLLAVTGGLAAPAIGGQMNFHFY
jgi:hypothetical protein